MSKIFLIGMPGCGKSTAGRLLAKKLKLDFIDLDEEIIKSEEMAIAAIFERKGEEYFRKCEQENLRRIIIDKPDFILATGGGTPCFFDNMELMNGSGESIFLDIDVAEIAERLKEERDIRPLLQGKEDLVTKLQDLREQRIQFYSKAHYTVNSDQELMQISDRLA